MDKDQIKWIIGIASVVIAVTVILMLVLSGFDVGNISIHKGIQL